MKKIISELKKCKLLKNKLVALALIILGALTIPIEYDITAFVFILMTALPLMFSKENLIYEKEKNYGK